MNQVIATIHEGNHSEVVWIIDSGATHYMTGNSKLFHEYKLLSGREKVFVADETKVLIVGCRSVSLMDK